MAVSRELTALRLTAQHIAPGTTGSAFAKPVDVARWMLAMQAQDLPGARWSVGLRLPHSTDAAIEAALAAGEIVRSWPMRGTLHLVAPEDLGWMLAVSAPRQSNWAAKRRRDLEITDEQLTRAGDIAVKLMTGGGHVRRDRLLEAWEAGGIPTTGQRGYHLLWNLGHSGLLVFGAPDGKQATFALLEEWVTRSKQLTGDEALGEFAARYFRSHGPATVQDFAWWASITLGDARKGLAIADDQLEERQFGGTAHYLAPGLEPAKRAVHALPGFDEYMLGYRDRSPALAAEFSDRIVPGNNGIFLPTIVVDGEVVGTWKRTDAARTTRVEIVEFRGLGSRARAAAQRAIERYGDFTGKPVEFTR
jgi:hypothetical protein